VVSQGGIAFAGMIDRKLHLSIRAAAFRDHAADLDSAFELRRSAETALRGDRSWYGSS
jgi:hypothetical protein